MTTKGDPLLNSSLIAISAATAQGGQSPVSSHFGRCPYFVLAHVEDGQVLALRSIENPYAGHHAPGQVPQFIAAQGATVMVSGGMGRRAVEFFAQQGIAVATGAGGTVQEALADYLRGKLRGATPCAESERHHRHS